MDIKVAIGKLAHNAIDIRHIFFVIALACLISLVLYVLHKVVRPILQITSNSKPLSEGRLDLHLDYHSKDELGCRSARPVFFLSV